MLATHACEVRGDLERVTELRGGVCECTNSVVCVSEQDGVLRGVHRVGVAFPEGLKLLPFYENLAKRQLLPFYAHSLSVTFTV